jgi:hypothetical protein
MIFIILCVVFFVVLFVGILGISFGAVGMVDDSEYSFRMLLAGLTIVFLTMYLRDIPIESKWYKLKQEVEYTTQDLCSSKELQSNNEYHTFTVKIYAQDINRDWTVKLNTIPYTTIVRTDYPIDFDIYLKCETRIPTGDEVHVWLKYKYKGKIFWENLPYIDGSRVIY